MADNVLTKNIGPFPVIAWVGIIGGGAALGLVIRRRGDAAKPAPALDAEAETPPGTAPRAGAPIDRSPVQQGGGNPVVGVGTATPAPTTNLEWQRAATNYLIARGIDPLVATSAISKYLDGAQLDAAESAALSMAIAGLGAPPEYVPTPKPTPIPPPIPRAAPAPPDYPNPFGRREYLDWYGPNSGQDQPAPQPIPDAERRRVAALDLARRRPGGIL